MEISPSEVRELVLADHKALRVRLELLRRAIKRADAEADPTPLLELLPSILTQLSIHLDLEDQILVPTLRTIDAWGPERVKRLTKEHAEQREWIRESKERLARNVDDVGRLAAQALVMIRRLEVDMAHEEEHVLSPEILDDSVIHIDFGG